MVEATLYACQCLVVEPGGNPSGVAQNNLPEWSCRAQLDFVMIVACTMRQSLTPLKASISNCSTTWTSAVGGVGQLSKRAPWDAAESQPSARATGFSDRTIRTGLMELDDPDPLAGHRQRRSGGGRKPHATTQPGLQEALDRLIEPTARGSPTNPLRWTIKSTPPTGGGVAEPGIPGERDLGAANAGGDALQSARQSQDAGRRSTSRSRWPVSPHQRQRATARKRRGEPAISVDTKKKEVLGNLKNPGKTYRPKGDPEKVKTHDFPDPDLGKAVPYGVYDIHGNEAASRWGSATTRPNSRWRRFAVGGKTGPQALPRSPAGCW